MGRKHWTDEKIFDRIIHNKTDSTYWENIRALRGRCNSYVFGRSMAMTKSGIKEHILIGVNILAQLGGSERPYLKATLKTCFELLKKKNDAEIISTVLYAISHNNQSLTDQEIRCLCSFKNASHLKIKQALTNALSGIEDMRAIDVLIYLSKDKNASVRDWATFGIGSQNTLDNEVVRAALWNRISDKIQAVRDEAMMGLALRKDAGIKNIVIKELASISYHSSLLLETIETLNDPDFISLLQQKLLEPGIEKRIHLNWIIKTIEKLRSSNQNSSSQ